MAEVAYWIAQNPPPAHFFLISGDKDFANILHRLRMNNYNVLLSTTDHTTAVLCSAATLMWPWVPLVKGEYATPKLYNYPPDGLTGSWYGYYKRALDDPFEDADHVPTYQPDETMERLCDVKPGQNHNQVPQSVIDGIRQTLCMYPEGATLSDFRKELRKNNIVLDKDFYGYKKFSLFLCSLPNIVKLVPPPDGIGQPIIFAVSNLHKFALETDHQPSKNGMKTIASTTSKIVTETQKEQSVEEFASSPTSNEATKEEPLASDIRSELTDQDCASKFSKEQDVGKQEVGGFSSIWKNLFGFKSTSSDVPMVAASGNPHVQNIKPTEKLETSISNLTASSGDSLVGNAGRLTRPANMSTGSSIPVEDEALPKESRGSKSVSSSKVGFFDRIARWWNKTNVIDESVGNNSEITEVQGNDNSSEGSSVDSQQPGHVLFTKSLFWDALEQFLLAPKGSDLILKSKTREELIYGLQKDGPWLLKDLKQSDLERLIDVLILEKMWIEVTPADFPFRLKLLPRKARDHITSNSLSSIIASLPTVSDGESKRKMRNREDILANCHKLLKELFVKHPDGFNLSIFRPSFVEKYGYDFDLKMLGYPKLASLVQIIPGVRVESSLVIPSEKFLPVPGSKQSEVMKESCLPDSKDKVADANGDDDTNGDDLWEELGPLSDTSRTKESFASAVLSDEEFSESENEVEYKEPSKQQFRSQDSSLLQVLDSWYSFKDQDSKDQSHSDDGKVDYLRRNATGPGKTYERTQQSCKLYSFVANSVDDEKEKVLGSILGSLKNSEPKING